MQTFLADIIPRLQRYSEQLDNLTLLTNQQWVFVDEINKSKTVYIFRTTKELLISKNGEVERAKWEYLGNKTLLLDIGSKAYLFKQGFFDQNVLALKIDGKEEYAFLVNENKYDGELNSFDRIIDFLQKKYIDPSIKGQIGVSDEKPIGISSTKPIILKSAEQIEKEKLELFQQIKEAEQRDNYYIMIFVSIALLFVVIILLASAIK